MKQFIQDFKDFALKGNILDLAVGVVIGGAFNKIIGSLVNDIIMPLISVIFNSGEINTLTLSLGKGSNGQEVLLRYGAFLQNILDFLIIAISIFITLRILLKFKRKKADEEAQTPVKSPELVVLEEIRDSLNK